MAVNNELTDRIRTALLQVKGVEEKKMFRGITFMVDGKMAISVGNDVMFRIDPAIHDEALKKTAASTMIMKGQEYKGYINVGGAGLEQEVDLQFWIDLALSFNPHAKATAKKNKK